MPVFYKDQKYLLFVHVPKTAGTSIEGLFAQAGWSIQYLDPGRGAASLNHLRRCSPQHMHRDMLESTWDLGQFDGIFMLVRNPYARWRSEYNMQSGKQVNLAAAAVESWSRQCLLAYQSNPFVCDNHIRPQHEFAVHGANVYRLEDGFESVVTQINNRFGIDLPPSGQIRMARKLEDGSRFDTSQIPLNDNTRQLVSSFYAGDFARFGYDARSQEYAGAGPG